MANAPDRTLVDEIFCPCCGYNLWGIPEDRCPECGFAYEHAAIHVIAAGSCARRLARYRRLVRCAAVSLCGALLAIASDQSTLGQCLLVALLIGLCLVEVGLFCCAACWTSLGAACFGSRLTLLGALYALPLLVAAGLAFPALARAAAMMALLLPLASWSCRPARFGSADRSLPHDQQRRLRRWQVTAWIAAGMALTVVLALYAAGG